MDCRRDNIEFFGRNKWNIVETNERLLKLVMDRKTFGRKPKDIFVRPQFRLKAESDRKGEFRPKESSSAKISSFGQVQNLFRTKLVDRKGIFWPKNVSFGQNVSFDISAESAETFQ